MEVRYHSFFSNFKDHAFKHLFNIRGHENRQAFWMNFLALFVIQAFFIIAICIFAMATALAATELQGHHVHLADKFGVAFSGIGLAIFCLAYCVISIWMLIIGITSSARRLADAGFSRFFTLLHLIPVGSFAIFIMNIFPTKFVANPYVKAFSEGVAYIDEECGATSEEEIEKTRQRYADDINRARKEAKAEGTYNKDYATKNTCQCNDEAADDLADRHQKEFAKAKEAAEQKAFEDAYTEVYAKAKAQAEKEAYEQAYQQAKAQAEAEVAAKKATAQAKAQTQSAANQAAEASAPAKDVAQASDAAKTEDATNNKKEA